MKKKYGRWEVLQEGTSRVYKDGQKQRYFVCRCDCGTVREVQLNSLIHGASKSCGCLNKELASEANSKHGESSTRLYRIHKAMKSRCTHKSRADFHRYGGRGITYAPEWKSYRTFRNWALANGYADHLTLDRINNDGNYEPSNCRWTTVKEQRRNMSSNVRISWNGEEMCLSEWAEKLGMNYQTLHNRIYTYGWDIDDAFTKKVGRCDTSRNASISWDGKEMSLSEWARELGMKYGTLYNRIYVHGLSIEDAFTKEVKC